MNAVVHAAEARGIKEVLHFTTNRGLVGMFHSGALLSRDDLNDDERLESVKLLNCPDRARDAAWTGYVNLSLTVVNQSMLNYSYRWHEHDGIWWAVLAFDVSILGEEGVFFTTCNNAHPVVKRAKGLPGFEAMFDKRVKWGQYGSVITRKPDCPTDRTTDIQAEILYPHSVPLAALKAVYVPQPEHVDDVAGYLATFSHVPTVPVECRPEIFE